MRKRLFAAIMATVMVIALYGCGEKPAETKETVTEEATEKAAEATKEESPEGTKAAVVAAEAIKNLFETTEADESSEAETEKASVSEPETTRASRPVIPEEEEGEEISDIKDAETGLNLKSHNGATVLHYETVVEKEDDYRIKGTIVELMTDRAVDRGWEYYYIDSLEDGAEIVTWYPKDGYFTSVAMVFECENLNEKPVIFGDTVKAKIVFDEGGKNKVFEGVSFQSNPGQIDSWGYENTRNSQFKDVNKDEMSLVSFIIDVDKEFHDAMVEEEIKEPTWVYVEFENGDRYCLNLRTEAIIFGYDDSDDESIITNDIHRTFKEATGKEYFMEFLTASPDFMDIVEKSGIDVEEAAEAYSSQFSVKVFDILFDSDTAATAQCVVTGPDFIEMYKELDVRSQKAFEGADMSKVTEDEFYKKMGELLIEYAKDPSLPKKDHDFEASYTYSEGAETWYPDDREYLMGCMRVPLINF